MKKDERFAAQEEESTIELLLAHLKEMRQAVPINYQLKAELKQKLQEQIKKLAQSESEPSGMQLQQARRGWWWGGAFLIVVAAMVLLIWPDDEIRLGSEQTLAVPVQQEAERTALAPFDEQVAYLADDEKLYIHQFVNEVPHERSYQLPKTDGRYGSLSWARSSRLAVTEEGGERSRLWVIDASDSGAQAKSQLVWEEPNGVLSSPDWSPDDRRIAFTRTRGTQSEIWITDLHTLKTTKWTEGHNPVWSPDGTLLAYVNQQKVWVMSLVDERTYQLGEGAYPSWADTDWLTYTTPDGQLASVQTTEQPFTVEMIPFSPEREGQLKRASWSRDGDHLLTAVETSQGMVFSIAKRD
ncbi:hypothetical protein LOK74_07275 [Brevibacillus humidisoli]|uniref:TolB family protein n=1 Tax=Brevibacillus humidisoli TaxID=2895522 RepID=UPI001E38C55B|nr:hypothetical protein [Brevibacillus humidisoli]UFJ42284.1 hypothetical protein LOK74_07275 [Brevibacillus humidisoli]